MGNYSLTFGSFVRSGNYPLEANYIFNSVEELQQWQSNEIARNDGEILHDGLLKIVKEKDSQTLYWCYNKEFYPLCDLDTFENLEFLKDFIGLVKDIDSLSENLKNLNNIQQELDLTQLSVGLNASGAFSTIAMQDTKYMSGARSIIDCLVALDKAISAKLVGGDGEIVDLEGYATEEWVKELNYLTLHQSLDDYYNKEEITNKFNNILKWYEAD